MRITLDDLGAVTGFSTTPGLCRSQSRIWCARHGIDWNDFRRNGIEAEQLLAVGDAFAIAIVEQARARRGDAEVDNGR